MYFGTVASNGPSEHCAHDWWLERIWWCGKLTGDNWSVHWKSCPSASLSTTNPMWTALQVNLGVCGDKPVTNWLSYGLVLHLFFIILVGLGGSWLSACLQIYWRTDKLHVSVSVLCRPLTVWENHCLVLNGKHTKLISCCRRTVGWECSL